MHEQVEPRTGADATINGGEWNIIDRDDLQYACIFPRPTSVSCPTLEQQIDAATSYCECTRYGDEVFMNPLCERLSQVNAKAYPSIRPLQVLRDFGPNSIVASICPKNTTDAQASDFGYRPAMAAIVDRLKERLLDRCLPRKLPVGRDGSVSCSIIEADPTGDGSCDASESREPVPASLVGSLLEQLERTGNCSSPTDCQRFNLCTITPLTPNSADFMSCLTAENPSGDGWCYVDPVQGLGDEGQVETCAGTDKQKIRFVGYGAPKKGAITFFACEG